jgi:hypothetical protein
VSPVSLRQNQHGDTKRQRSAFAFVFGPPPQV